MKNAERFVVGLLLCLASALSAAAQDRGLDVVAKSVAGADVRIGKQYAVLIAVDRYKEWTPLRNPVKDAKTIKDILQRRYHIDEFVELYDENASAVGIRRLFSDLIDRTMQNDSVLIYYAGHGYTDKFKTGFWIPVDGGKDVESQDRWIPNQQIRNFVSQMKARSIALVSDSCFSGDLLNVHRGAAPAADSAYFRNALKYTARQVLTSGASETVPDESEFSRQFKAFLENNTEVCVDPLAMYDRIRRGVTKTLPLLGTLPGQEEGGSFVLFLREGGTLPATAGLGSVPSSYRAPSGGDAELMVTVQGGAKGVEIFVNGAKMGDAPALLQKLPSDVPLVVEVRSGLDAGKAELTLKPRELREVSLKLERQKGNLVIETGARDAELLLDGKSRGPLGSGVVKDIAAGEYALELKAPGLHYSGKVVVPPNETVKISPKFYDVGYAEFAVEPKDAEISLDGAKLRSRGGATTLAAGTHEIAVRAAGYRDSVRMVTIEKGKTIAIATRLAEFAPASVTVKNPPFGAQFRASLKAGNISSGVRDASVSERDLNAASLSMDGLPAGRPVVFSVSVPFADSLSTGYAAREVTFAEGAKESMEFAVGKFSVPFIPKGSEVRCVPGGVAPDSSAAVPIPMTVSGAALSPNLAAGTYTVSLSGEYARPFKVTIEAGKTVEPAGYREFLSSVLSGKKMAADSAAKSKAARTTAGWATFGLGLAGTAATAASYFLGAQARAAYEAAETSADLQAARQSVQFWGTLFAASAGVGGAGFGLTPILWGGPSQKSFDDAARELDEQIRLLVK